VPWQQHKIDDKQHDTTSNTARQTTRQDKQQDEAELSEISINNLQSFNLPRDTTATLLPNPLLLTAWLATGFAMPTSKQQEALNTIREGFPTRASCESNPGTQVAACRLLQCSHGMFTCCSSL
jgi:hypothetical protein